MIAAYNEKDVIRGKLENSLEIDYPKDRLEIVVVSDCSSDGTDEIVRSFSEKGIRLHRMAKRSGKVAGHKSALKHIECDILVFSDAATIYHKSAIKELVRRFSNPDVACVGGSLSYKNPDQSMTGRNEQTYWSYETFIRRLESRFDSLPAVSGAIYALRSEMYQDVPDHLADDLINPLYVRRLGYRSVFEPKAMCWDIATKNLGDEFAKRRRIAAQNAAGLIYMRDLLDPFKYMRFSWILISHKLLRLILPVFLMVLYICGLMLPACAIQWTIMTFLMNSFLLLSLIGFFLEHISIKNRIFSFPLYFVLSNLAILFGILEALAGKKHGTWE